MTRANNLGDRPPLGLKTAKPAKPARKPLPRRSKKREAYMCSAERRAGLAHMRRVKKLDCIICGHPAPSYAHHVTGDGKPRNDFRVLPLCFDCHQGPNGYHNAKATWVATNGHDFEFLATVAAMLAGELTPIRNPQGADR